MRLYDTISQSDLNDAIDLLVYNYHRELSLDIDDPSNSYCSLGFDLSDGVDAGEEVIFNSGDNLRISVDDKRLALMGYTLRFYYYLLDKGDYSDSKSYGDLRSFDVKLDSDEVVVPFTDNQVYLQKNFELILLKDIGYRLLLSTPSSVVMPNEDVVLTADYTLGSVPVEDATVEFYNGETLIGTGVTDSDGLAVLTVSNPSMGSHNFNAVCDGVYSDSVSVTVGSNNVMELTVTGSSLRAGYASAPFTYTGRVFIDWGDGTIVEYVGGELNHSFNDGLTSHTVKVNGDITALETSCFYGCTGLTSVIIPSSVTRLRGMCFYGCTGLTSINIPSSVTQMDNWIFADCTSLTSINLNWTSTDILNYQKGWILGASSSLKFSIPNGTTSLYTAKSYPSDKLEERT